MMASITLTAKQEKAIQQARASGKRRVVMELTDEQRAAVKKAAVEVEAEREEITRKARQALAEQRACEAELLKVAYLLAAAREQCAISLSELAERTGITRQALSRIERGEHTNPTFSTLQRIASALGKKVIIQLRDVA
ncbi:MAG: helix-turn-helix domain-containing protein [Pirellulales bacterium]